MIDFKSQEGAKVKALLEARLEEQRSKLENVTLSERDTQVIRGTVQELRNLLSTPMPYVVAPRYSGPPRSFNEGGQY